MGVCYEKRKSPPIAPLEVIDPNMAHISKSMCKITFGNQTATGFLIKLFKGHKEFFCMMTCKHVITREMIKQRQTIYFYYDSINFKNKEIKLDPNKRFIQDFERLSDIDKNIDINIDATVIEILPGDNIPGAFFLTLNENYMDNYESLKGQSIAIMQYPEGKLKYSYGEISEIDKYDITHTANTDPGASGSPIFLRNSIKVIGIHTGGSTDKSENYGYCLGPIYNYFKNFSYKQKALNHVIYNEIISIKNLANNKLNKMTLIYRIKEEEPVKIFGKYFVEKNKNNCYLLIGGRKRELCETLDEHEFAAINGLFQIMLIEENTITDMSSMFSTDILCQQKNLIIVQDISEWDTTNVTNMSQMFNNCISLISLPDISKWNTKNVKEMNGMFSNCFSLKSLPDISKWNTSNVKDMSFMFANCVSLKSLPDISKWDTTNVINMSIMFCVCSSLISLPDISKWNTSNAINMNWMFRYCSSLTSLPDITKWKLNQRLRKEFMFQGCNEIIVPEKFKK